MGLFNKTKQHPSDVYAEQVIFEALNDGSISALASGPVKEGKR